MSNYKNILIIQTAFIGDAILASSLVEKLHTFFPDAQLSILVRKGNESLYHQHPFLKDVLFWDKQQHKKRNLFNLLLNIRKNKYDCVINCHRFASSGLLTGFSGAKHKAGYKQNPFSFLFNFTVKHELLTGFHEVERYNQLIVDFTDKSIVKPKLYPSKLDKEFVQQFKQENYVCIAPSSAWFTKQLPIHKWIELIQTLPTHLSIYLLGAGIDKVMADEIIAKTNHQKIHNLCGKLSLLQTYALMADAQMNYVNDSAPLHMTSGSNAPVTAYFLSTVPMFGFGPLSDNSTVKEVRTLNCRPCGEHGYKTCPQGHFKCGIDMVI